MCRVEYCLNNGLGYVSIYAYSLKTVFSLLRLQHQAARTSRPVSPPLSQAIIVRKRLAWTSMHFVPLLSSVFCPYCTSTYMLHVPLLAFFCRTSYLCGLNSQTLRALGCTLLPFSGLMQPSCQLVIWFMHTKGKSAEQSGWRSPHVNVNLNSNHAHKFTN